MADQPPIMPTTAGMVILNWFRRNLKFILLIVFIVVLIIIGNSLSSILTPVLIALILAYILNPIVNLFERRNVNRTVAITFIIMTFYWVVVVGGIIFFGAVGEQFERLVNSLLSEDYEDVTGDDEISANIFYIDEDGNGEFTEGKEELLFADNWEEGTETLPQKFRIMIKVGNKYILKGKETKEENDSKTDTESDKKTNKDSEKKTDTEKDKKNYEVEFEEGKEYLFAEFVDNNGNNRLDTGLPYDIVAYVKKVLKGEGKKGAASEFDEIVKQIKEETIHPKNTERIAGLGFNIVKGVLGFVGDSVASIVWFVLMLILIPIYTFYFLRGMNGIRDIIIDFLPVKKRQEILDILFEIHMTVGAFFRGRLLVSLIVAVVTAVALEFLGVPFAILIGFIHGITIIIPFASAILVAVPTLILVYFSFEHDPSMYAIPELWITMIVVLIVFIVIQWGEQIFLTPLLLSRSVELHPMVVIVSIFIGANLLGFFGVIIAIPVASVIKILGREFFVPTLRELAQERKPTT